VSGAFLFNLLSIILIDVLLGGDNAVVIALAVRSLPPKQRRIGVSVGAGGAVLLRIVLTFFAARILELNYVQLGGGILILWIAVKLLIDAAGEDSETVNPAKGLRHAIWLILVADVTMSLDNIVAVAAASHGNLILLAIGLGLSIPFVVFTSTLLSRVIDRYPVVVWAGAAILGSVGGDMMVTDPWVERWIHPSKAFVIGTQIFFAAAVPIAGKLATRRAR
jgi:YjbE family integral membrane protein